PPLPLPGGDWRKFGDRAISQNENLSALQMIDVSFFPRFGVKGAGAAAWLQAQGIPVPDRPNTWIDSSEGDRVLRLGLTEFLIEGKSALSLMAACQDPPAKVYPVLRQDGAFVLRGKGVNDLLSQTCSIHFRSLKLTDRPILLTSMVGVAVTALPGEEEYRIWSDGTLAPYLKRTLWEVANELKDEAVDGMQKHF
ncbi:MAG: hypothetical protein SFW36_08465, partial [Leptolyngbyaceae cyanobacterium bins.59]|nr:hypothetical protein [Leptolyngbyaceae cyanobacterium bins.59]